MTRKFNSVDLCMAVGLVANLGAAVSLFCGNRDWALIFFCAGFAWTLAAV